MACIIFVQHPNTDPNLLHTYLDNSFCPLVPSVYVHECIPTPAD